MENQVQKPAGDTPFFSLMAEAEEIQVQEMAPQSAVLVPEAESVRTFVVKIRPNRPVPAPAVAAKEKSEAATVEREALLANAKVLVENKDFLLARNVYSFVLKQDIRDKGALEGLGICFLSLGEPNAARKCFKALWELYSSQPNLVRLGLCYLKEGQDAFAMEHFAKVTAPDTFEPGLRFEFHKDFGNCLTRAGQFDLAAYHYQRALEVQPNSETIYINLGTLELQRKRFELSQNYFVKATQIDPQSAKAHCGLGLLDLSRGDYFSAGKEFSMTLDIDSQNLTALLQLTHLADYSKVYGPVKIRLAQFLLKDPGNLEVRYTLASVLFKEGGPIEAEREVDSILLRDPRHPKALSLKQDIMNSKHRG